MEDVTGEAYPEVPLYRYEWTQPDAPTMREQLGPAGGRGPGAAQGGNASLAGKTLTIVTDNGPKLSYRFISPTQLMYGEGDEAAFAAGYGALNIDRVTLFTHLIPGSLRGYAVAIDNDTRLATVAELWFGGDPKPREVNREFYYGYVLADGEAAPETRHATTARVEGKGLKWTDDRGHETIEYYCTVSYCNVVDRTRDKGEFGYAFPADYIRLTEDLYLLTRTEAEFSGIMTLFVMDANRLKQAGVRLGFNTADKLEYYMFTGDAEWLGQIARFEEFAVVSGNPLKPQTPGKGARVVYRPFATMEKMTKEKVAEVAAKPNAFTGPSIMAGFGNPPSGALAGRELSIHYDDGPKMDYRFKTADTLEWRKDGSGWQEARYNAWESAPGAFIFGHFLAGTPDFDGHIVTMDLDAGLATLFRGYVNTPYVPNEAWSETKFGVVKGVGIPDPGANRHQFSNDMVGRCMTWSYSPGLTSMHLYPTPNTVSWIIFTPDAHGGTSWAGPGEFVKIRDGLYFQYWREDACNGTLGTILVNMRTMHDAGIGYHCGERGGLSMSAVGAYARHAGKFDVEKYFNGKRRA